MRALDQPREQIIAVRPAAGEAFVLLQPTEGLLTERWVYYSGDRALDPFDSAIYLDLVRAHVGPLVDNSLMVVRPQPVPCLRGLPLYLWPGEGSPSSLRRFASE
jgi:hypothetical protein